MLQSSGYQTGDPSTERHGHNFKRTRECIAHHLEGISESVARRVNPYNVKIAHKPHSALRPNLVRVKYPVPTLKRRKPWHHMSMIILGGIRETEELPTQWKDRDDNQWLNEIDVNFCEPGTVCLKTFTALPFICITFVAPTL